MENIKQLICYLIIFTFSVALGSWLCRYTSLSSVKPKKLEVIKKQLKDEKFTAAQKIGIFCSLQPYPVYPGYYSGYSRNTSKEAANVGIPRCSATGYQQCTNNVYSPAIDPKDNEDYFDRTILPVGSDSKCQYGSTYSSCYPKQKQSELQQIQDSYCKIKNLENNESNRNGSRVNIYNMDTEIERLDD